LFNVDLGDDPDAKLFQAHAATKLKDYIKDGYGGDYFEDERL